MFGTRRITPATQVDRRGEFESLIVKGFTNVREFPPCGDIRFNVIVPQFDGNVSDFASNTNFIQDGSWSDGAGIQAISKRGHL